MHILSIKITDAKLKTKTPQVFSSLTCKHFSFIGRTVTIFYPGTIRGKHLDSTETCKMNNCWHLLGKKRKIQHFDRFYTATLLGYSKCLINTAGGILPTCIFHLHSPLRFCSGLLRINIHNNRIADVLIFCADLSIFSNQNGNRAGRESEI